MIPTLTISVELAQLLGGTVVIDDFCLAWQ
jgi:hypothetical protein